MEVIDEGIQQNISDYAATLPLSQAKQIYTAYKNKELNVPYQIPEENKTERIVLGSLQRFGQQFEVIPEGLGILGGEIMMLEGNIFKNTPFAGAFFEKERKMGESLLNSANSSLERKRKEQAQALLPMTQEELESPAVKATTIGLDYLSQIALALGTGGTVSLATMGTRMAAGTAVEGLEQYKKEHPEDTSLSGFATTGNLGKEIVLNTLKTGTNLFVEKAIGAPKQAESFMKAIKSPVATGAKGVAKAAGKAYAMGFAEEWGTETIQGITDTTFDAFLGRFKDMKELSDAYMGSVSDAVYAGFFGGGFGASGHVLARGLAIGNVKEMMSGVVPEEDLEKVATAIVDNHIASAKNMMATQLALSTQLRDKHGEIFNAMNVAAKQAMMESGVTNTMTEDEIAQHATELSTLFADQVLAEANKRNVPIIEVIDGKDLIYDRETKELRLAPKKVVDAVRKIRETRPVSMLEFIKRNGGIKDEHGELKALDAIKGRPGLVNNKSGMSLDEALAMVAEAGYLGVPAKLNMGELSPSDLLDAIDTELRGKKILTEEGQAKQAKIEEAKEYDTSEEEDYYDMNLLAKGVSEEELAQMNFDEKKQAYQMSKEDDGTYIGEDGLLHAADGSVLFQTDVTQRINEIDEEEKAKGVPEYTAPTININGVERQTTNSDGNPIAKSEKSLRYFYDWFGDSKVVDEQGRPLVVYHGTNAEFDTFDKNKAFDGAFYFSPNKEYAKGYGNIMPTYLSIKNPTTTIPASRNQKEGFSKQGFDGVAFKDRTGLEIFAAFNPNQIKSIYNRGTFSSSENTYYQEGNYDIKKVSDDTSNIEKFREKNEEYNQKATPKGTFDAKSKVIQLFEKADASTLDHELAHFWLDNMWTYANSGAASEQYIAQFNAVKDYLGVRPDQRYLTRSQHEKFASAYEKYIYRGVLPTSLMGNVFDNYERFIRNVYASINDIKQNGRTKVRLTPDIINFFDSMIKGGIDTTSATEQIASEVRNEEAQKVDDTVIKEANNIEKDMPVREIQPEVKPVKVETEKKESRLFNRLKGLAGEKGVVEYDVAHIEEQREKARKMWQENPQKAQAILNGTEPAEDILRQVLFTEQQKIALENGDTTTFLNSLRKQTAEATRMGQELSALRGVVEDITDPAYWIRSAELEAFKTLAKKNTKNLENAMGNSPLVELTSRLDADIKDLQKNVASKETNEEKMSALKEGIKTISEKYKGLEQPQTVFNQIDWSNEELADDYIESKVKEKLGIILPKDTAKAFIQTARELDTLSRQRDDMGNPVQAFFVKKDELERMRNAHTPTARTKVLISTIGRSNMLTAPATSVLNVVSNTQNYIVENLVRKVGNALEGKTNDNIVSKELMDKYRGKAWNIFWTTGYDMSFMTSLLDERLYKGESVSHSEGEGAIRAVGRFAEKYVFSRLISSPDIYFKSVLGFTNYLGNEATDVAYKEGLTGEKAKARANELFLDAIKIEPQTELGKKIRAKAQTDALILTFQQDTQLARMLLDVRNAINKGTGDIGIGDIMSPFIKTPANILSMSFDAAVGPFASPKNLLGALQDIKAKNYKSARVLQAAKQTTTAMLAYTVIASLASMFIDDDDYIPDYAQLTSKERAAVRARGGSFGSIRVGGEYISTDFFGVFEMPLVTFLNSRRTGNILQGIASGVGSKFVDAPVLKDIIGSSEAIKEMATSKDDIISAIGENVANAAISRLTPNALATVAKLIDNKERKAESVGEKIIARIPFAREQLPERLNVGTGEAIEMQRINTLLLGSRGKYQESDAVAMEIGRLADVKTPVSISDPTRSGFLSKISKESKEKAQEQYVKEYYRKAKALITKGSYKRASDEEKRDMLDKIRNEVVKELKRKYNKEIKVLKKGKK